MNDLIGKRYERLVVVDYYGKTKQGMNVWKCKCDCGNIVCVPVNRLNSGHTRSCGCLAKELARQKMKTHGLRNTRLYKIWANIKSRTNINNNSCRNNYRKFGIKMCNEWKNDFKVFYDWAINNGYADNLTIDRINNFGDYEPKNCRWATIEEQMNNQTTNKKIKYNGKTKTLAQWVSLLNLNYSLVEMRLLNGWSVDRAFNESNDKKNYYEYQNEKLTIDQICKKTGLSKANVWNRIHRKWTIERIMTQPARGFKENKYV